MIQLPFSKCTLATMVMATVATAFAIVCLVNALDWFARQQKVYVRHFKEMIVDGPGDLNLVRSNNTIVTAYFHLNSTTNKHKNYEYYIDLMSRLFSSDDPMVIFTPPTLLPTLTHLRGKPERTLLIPLELNETKMAKSFSKSFWSNVSKHGRGPCINRGRNYELFQIWNSKVDLLKKVSDWNPFHSSFFAWVDAGLVRWDQYTNSTILQRVPPELPTNQMMLLNVTPIVFHKRYHQMGGGLLGGYKPAINLYHEKYYEKLYEYGNSPDPSTYTILSNEQVILHDTCNSSPELCFVVTPKKRQNSFSPCLTHPYFYMLPFLNEKEYHIMDRTGLVSKNG